MRYLIAAGTRHYREDPELPLAHDDVAAVVRLFASMGYQQLLHSVSHDPDAEDFENALSDWCHTPGLCADDVVIVYYAGHGDRSPGGQYRLACANSVRGRPRSWLSLPNLAEVLATSPVRNVLFVVDACHAAAAGTEIGTVTDAIVATRGRGDVSGSGTWLLASARHRDAAVDGAFVSELAKACRQGDGPSQRYVSPGTVADRVNYSFVSAGLRQSAACSSVDQSDRPPFFVNPAFDRQAEITGDGRAYGEVTDRSSHFEPRGRGVEHVHDPGSYFTGRDRALREVRAHLSGERGGGMLVVTAAPGSGKSAVLGRVVLEECADTTVNARHQTVEALVGRLAAAADVQAATPVALFAALAGREKPFRVVVDSLDEAGPGGDKAEARRLAWELLRPLGTVPCIRLAVGARRELLPHLGDRVPVVDLDDAEYADDTDTADYVTKILSDQGALYEHTPGLARRVAEEVARRAGHCFLVARMTANALLRGPVVDLGVAGWAERLPSDVGGAFEAYLQRLPSDRHASTMALLTALAFGEGSGLPRRIWISVAERLSGIHLTEVQVDSLLRDDGSYLTYAKVAGVTHFRLYHQELTDHLRQWVLQQRDVRDLQKCFVEALTELVPDGDWARAPAYVRGNLATHAAAAGMLDELIEDASFVLAVEPATLLSAARGAVRRPALSMAVERCAHLLANVNPAEVEPAALLAFVAGMYGESGLASRAQELSPSLEWMVVEHREITPHRVVGRHEGDAYSTTLVSTGWIVENLVLPDGSRAVLAALPGRADVHVWLLDEPARSTILPHPAYVLGLALVPGRSGRQRAVTLDAEGTLRVWDIMDQAVVRTLRATGCTRLFDAGALSHGTSVIVCGDEEHVAAFDLDAWRLLIEVDCPSPPTRGVDPLGASACLSLDAEGRTHLLVCDGVRGKVTLHPLERQGAGDVVLGSANQPVLMDHVIGPRGGVAAIAEPGERLTLVDVGSHTAESMHFSGFSGVGGSFAHGTKSPLLVAQEPDSLLVAPLHGVPWRAALPRVQESMLVKPVVHDGCLFVVTASTFDNRLSVVDCTVGNGFGTPLHGHDALVGAIHLLNAPGCGASDILTVANDGTARLWPWPTRGTRAAAEALPAEHSASTSAEVDALIPWSRDSAAVISVSRQLFNRVTLPPPGTPSNTRTLSLNQRLPINGYIAGKAFCEDPDGTLHLLAAGSSGISASREANLRIWYRLYPDRTIEQTQLPWSSSDFGTHVHLAPATGTNPHPRFFGFDAVRGRVQLLSGPHDISDSVSLPWPVDPRTDHVCSTGFTAPSGHTVLLTGIRAAQLWERSVGGNAPPGADEDRQATWAAPHEPAPATGQLWDVSTGRQGGPVIELAHDLVLLTPHHGSRGTRWVAQRGRDSTTTVIDLATNRHYLVCPPRPLTDEEHRGGIDSPDDDELLRWSGDPTNTPVLLALDPRTVDDAHPGPVTVWNASTPEATGTLPVLASRLLWTGLSPNGESLVAVSDAHGVALCHLPSCAKVWAVPLPARVTAVTAFPGSEHLDLAVGTQQGVVLLRPRLTAAWRERLGVAA